MCLDGTMRRIFLSASAILDIGFVYVGSWTNDASRPHKATWIRQQSGLYAFIIGDSVMYLGATAFLDKRLRHYSRLAFTNVSGEPREVHRKISSCIKQGIEVAVAARIHPNAPMENLSHELGKLVKEINPIWNAMTEGNFSTQRLSK